MSATRTSATISQIEEDMIEQEALIEQERSYEGPILRNENYTAQNPTDTTTSLTSSTTTTSITTTSTKTTSGPKPGTKQQETNDNPPDNVNVLDDRESHRKHGLCGSSKCIWHWACRDPLLYRMSVCDRLTNLLHTRRHYDLIQL